MLQRLVLRQRGIGDRGEQESVRARLFRITRVGHRLVGAERAHPDDHRQPAADHLDRGLDRAAPLRPREIHVDAGAAEQTDGLRPAVDDPLQQLLQCLDVHPPGRIGRRQRKGGKAGEEWHGLAHEQLAEGQELPWVSIGPAGSRQAGRAGFFATLL